jgi:hypothetical protein
VSGVVCGHTIGILACPGESLREVLQIVAFLNSLTYDWVLRQRLGGSGGVSALDPSKIVDLPLPPKGSRWHSDVALLSARLCFASPLFGHAWVSMGLPDDSNLPRLWAQTHAERTRIRSILDAVCFAAYGLQNAGVRSIVDSCDRPLEATTSVWQGRLLDPKSFWRVDKDKDPELRHTVLSLIAFHDLEEKIRVSGGDRDAGVEAFLGQNDGEGWMLPETLRLADYGLGHDERAEQPQPVASRLGSRFYDWQLAQSAEESWRECHLHTRNLLGEQGYRELLRDIEANECGMRERSGVLPLQPKESADVQDKLFP